MKRFYGKNIDTRLYLQNFKLLDEEKEIGNTQVYLRNFNICFQFITKK